MSVIGFLVSHHHYPADPVRDPTGEANRQFARFRTALEARGLGCEPVFLEDDFPDWSRFAAVCVVMAWGYPRRIERFVEALDSIAASGVAMVNGPVTVRRNLDKAYLDDLAALGIPVPVTVTVPAVTQGTVDEAFASLGCAEVVIKPQVGGGAWRQVRLARGAALPASEDLPPAGALIQPFLSGVPKLGELSLLVFGRTVSHGLSKVPKAGDYRTQGAFGATETGITVPDSAIELASQTLAAWHRLTGEHVTYARIDLVPASDAAAAIGDVTDWLVMELEVIEPYLYLGNRPDSAEAGAEAFVDALLGAIAPVREPA